jgi:hypothetical protein
MLRGIYSAIYGAVNISVSVCVEIKGDDIEKYQIYFISVTFKRWSGRKLLNPTSYVAVNNILNIESPAMEIQQFLTLIVLLHKGFVSANNL